MYSDFMLDRMCKNAYNSFVLAVVAESAYAHV